MHTYMHACIHTCMHTYVHTYIMHACMHAYVHTYMHACMHTYIHTYMHTCLHLGFWEVRVHLQRNVHAHICLTYVHVHVHKSPAASKFVCTFRALFRAEMERLMTEAGLVDVQVLHSPVSPFSSFSLCHPFSPFNRSTT